jgi:hypothetical protein
MRLLLFISFIFWIGEKGFAQSQRNILFQHNKMAIVQNDSQLSDFIYTEVGPYVEKRQWVNKGEWYGYINENGDSITPFIYHDVSSFHEGFARVGIADSFTFINQKGEAISRMLYAEARDFKNGFAAVKVDSVWGLIDTTGNMIIKPQFEAPPILTGAPDFIRVRKDGLWGVIDGSGKTLFNTDYQCITPKAMAYKNGFKIKLYAK